MQAQHRSQLTISPTQHLLQASQSALLWHAACHAAPCAGEYDQACRLESTQGCAAQLSSRDMCREAAGSGGGLQEAASGQISDGSWSSVHGPASRRQHLQLSPLLSQLLLGAWPASLALLLGALGSCDDAVTPVQSSSVGNLRGMVCSCPWPFAVLGYHAIPSPVAV